MINFDNIAVNIELGSRRHERVHDKVLAKLIWFIFSQLSDIINFDHVDLPIVKHPLSLELEGRKYDITFLAGDYQVWIEVKTRKVKEPLLAK